MVSRGEYLPYKAKKPKRDVSLYSIFSGYLRLLITHSIDRINRGEATYGYGAGSSYRVFPLQLCYVLYIIVQKHSLIDYELTSIAYVIII